MTDWNQIVFEALKQLGADKEMTRGAKLRALVGQLARERGADLQEYLEAREWKFRELVERIPGIQCITKPGTDMFVGLEGAIWPVANGAATDHKLSGPLLRKDVYEALSRISNHPYYYVPTLDKFTSAPPEHERKVALPPVTRDELHGERREFAQTIENKKAKGDLLNAVERAAYPLGEFRRAILEHDLLREWHNYKAQRLVQRLQSWAALNNLEVEPSWFEGTRRETESDQELLSRISGYMTREELDAIEIPFRAVKAMYLDLIRKRNR